MMTFGEMIFWHASRNPNKPALIGPGRIVTYGGLRDAIGAFALRVQDLGWTPGGTVAILVDERLGHLIAAAALSRLGFVTMSARSWEDVQESGVPLAGVLAGLPAPAGLQVACAQVDRSWYSDGRNLPAPPSAVLPADHLHHIALTSGSTGRPKPVGFDANAIREVQIQVGFVGDAIAWDRLCCFPNMQTFFGYGYMTMALVRGKTLVYADTVEESMHLVSLFGAEWIVASNIQLERIVHMQATQPLACPNLRLVFFGGSLMTQRLLRAAKVYLSTQIICGYGSTEAGLIAISPAERLPQRDGATGFLAPWVTFETVDGEGRVLPPGSEGVIRLRTASQCRPFNPETRAFDAVDPVDGWSYPGDAGLVQPDGVLVISGRTNESINAGGVKIAPELLEDALRGHPEVAEAAVVGLPDPFGVEETWVVVVPRNPGADVDALGRECLERIRQVKVRQVVFVDTLPRTELGKIARGEVRKALQAMNGAGAADKVWSPRPDGVS